MPDFDPTRPQNHYRTELNNFLQVNGGSRRLQWQISSQGPDHELIWTVICYIDELEYGRASCKTLGDAKERAAHMAHRALAFPNFCRLGGMAAWHSQRKCIAGSNHRRFHSAILLYILQCYDPLFLCGCFNYL